MRSAVIEKKDILNAVKVLELVPLRAGVPSSDFIKMTARKQSILMSLSSTVTAVVRAPYQSGGLEQKVIFIDRGLFTAYVLAGAKWKGDFEFGLDEDKLHLKQGRRKAEFNLRAEPLGGYGEWRTKDGHKEIKLDENLKNMLLASNACATGDPSMPHLNCVYINGQLVLSTNDRSLFVGRRSTKEDGLEIPFPVGIIPLLGGDLVDSVGVDGDRVVLDCGCGYVEGTVSAPAKKDFPKAGMEKSIKVARAWPLFVNLPATKIERILERLVAYLPSVKREDWVVTLQLSKGQVKAYVAVQQGRFEESTKVEGLAEEGNIKMRLDMVYPVIRYIASTDTKENPAEIFIRVDESKKTPFHIANDKKNADVEMMAGRIS